MKHRLYLPTFLPVSFPDAMETFLEDMAKKGWFLKKVGYFLSFCQFEKGTPAPVRYRLEPIPDTVRTPSAEIHCDPLVQAKGYKRMCRNFSVFGLAALVLLAIFLGIPLYHPSFLLERPRFSAFALVTLLAFAVLILWSVLRLWKIYRNLSQGNPLSHHKGYLHILSLQTIVLALFVLFLLPFSDKLVEWDENDQITQSLTSVEEPLPYVLWRKWAFLPTGCRPLTTPLPWAMKTATPIMYAAAQTSSHLPHSTSVRRLITQTLTCQPLPHP